MAPSLLLLLLCSLCLSVDCRRPPHQEATRKPHNTKTTRLPKADDGAKHSVIDLSDDNNNEPDSQGEFTMASLSKPDMPRDFTICTAFMVQAWTTDFSEASLFLVRDVNNYDWAHVDLYAADTYSQFIVYLGEVYILTTIDHVLFPLTWTHVCLSLDTISGKVGIVVNGQLVQEEVHQEALEEDVWRPSNMSLVLGYSKVMGHEYTGMTSKLNIFSSALSTSRMVALTEAGGEECGSPGDYVSWEEEDWQLHSQARREMVGELEGPCRRESRLTVYSADFKYHSAATNYAKISGCMEHCEKLGKGRSPPVRTQEEWTWLWKEVNCITPELWRLPYLWLAATDEEKEGVWRDYYTQQKLETGVAWPWYSKYNDTFHGDKYNCPRMYTDESLENTWEEGTCFSSNIGCPCQYETQPILRLRGLCSYTLDDQYTPKQLATSPNDLIILGQYTSRIQYSDSSSQWILTDAVSNVTAVSVSST